MPFRSLRTRLLLTSAVLLATVVAATLVWVGYQASRLVNGRLAADLARAGTLIRTSQEDRYASLRGTADLLAAFPDLNALAQTDAATMRDFLLDYQRRTERADLLVLLSPQGEVLARTDSVTAAPVEHVESRWIAPTLRGEPPTTLLETASATYMATAAAAEAAGTVFAVLIVGQRMDDELAQRLRDTTGEETIILGRSSVLGSTLARDTIPWSSAPEWTRRAATSPASTSVTIAGEQYAVQQAATSDPDGATFLSLQSRDRAMAPYRRMQLGLLLVGLVGAGLGSAVAALLARRVAAPVARLVDGTQQVASGNFECAIEPSGITELDALAHSFNQMTRGLRERADMQKFVSQSTVQMIQSAAPAASASERKELTVLFSDIRGFTRFSEAHAPEAVVAMLNQCLGLAAERVRRFGGDVDKFVGDCVVALFDGEDRDLRAIRCAVDIQRAMDAQAAAGGPVAVGIGIASGEVVVGSIGGGDRFDYTAVGLQVNVASRLCAMAEPREILMSEATWLPVRDLVAAERRDEVVVRGLAHPVPVYRMVVGHERGGH